MTLSGTPNPVSASCGTSNQTAASNQIGTKFTCSGCLVVFTGFEEQRAHYQSDWHRYNLNRKVKGHPPITLNHYNELLGRQDSPEISSFDCKECEKSFRGENALYSHIQTTGHTLSWDAEESEEQMELLLKERLEANKLDISRDCLFCSQHKSDSFSRNMEHMTTQHGLYVPDIDFLTDLEGLIEYLADKMTVGYCLWCGGEDSLRKPFGSLEAVRRHMRDKGHTKIRFDEEGSSELGDFYEWTFNDTQLDVPSELSGPFITPDGTELITADGSRIGNREYWKYYKQYLRPYDLDESQQQKREERERGRHLMRSRTQYGQLTEHRQYTAEEKNDQRVEQQSMKAKYLAEGVRSTSFLPNFRLQL